MTIHSMSLEYNGVSGITGRPQVSVPGATALRQMPPAKTVSSVKGGPPGVLQSQVIAIVVAAAAFSFCATWLIATAVTRTIGFRASPR